MWNLVGPLPVRLMGYRAWSKLGMGKDLPKGVNRDQKHWCRFPCYFFINPAMSHVAGRSAGVTTPIIVGNSLDDRWVPPASRGAFMSGYRGTRWQDGAIDPVGS